MILHFLMKRLLRERQAITCGIPKHFASRYAGPQPAGSQKPKDLNQALKPEALNLRNPEPSFFKQVRRVRRKPAKKIVIVQGMGHLRASRIQG